MNLRIPTLSILASVGLLSACGGGGGLDEGTKVPTPAEALVAAAKPGSVRTITEARRAASQLLLPLLPQRTSSAQKAGGLGRAGGDEAVLRSRATGNDEKALQNCAGGGTVSDSVQNGVNVGSPYTEQPFDLTVTTYSLCKESTQDDTETRSIATSGARKDGSVISGESEFDYTQIGESAAQPLRISTQRQSKPGVSPFNFTINTESYGLYHYRFESNLDSQRYSTYLGTISGTEGGDRIDGAFYLQRGMSAGNRFRRDFTSEGSVYQGSLASALLSEPASLTEHCGAGGTFTMITVSPLLDNDLSEGQLISGTVQLQAGGQTATYVFSGNGALEITAGDGSKTTINQAELTACPVLEIF